MTPPRLNLGLAGGLTRTFIGSPLTPLFLLAAFVLGLVALISLPREEEPQISVPMVDIRVQANGLKTEDAVKLVTEPLETIVKAIDGVEHVYSQTEDDVRSSRRDSRSAPMPMPRSCGCMRRSGRTWTASPSAFPIR